MARKQRARLAEKTVERQFVHELETDFELAPATSRAVLATAQQVLLTSSEDGKVREGQMRVTVVSVDGGLSDLEILERFGGKGCRRVRLLRVSEEAIDQGGVLTQEDLARLLQTDVRTVRRDVSALREEGYWIPTRGTVKEMGRGQSHKAKIVEMYLRRMTYSEIVRKAPHSPDAIKRYVEMFGRVVVLWEKGVRDVGEIAYVVGLSTRLAGEYLVLRERDDRPAYQDRMEEIARYSAAGVAWGGAVKKGALDEDPAGPI